MKAEATVPSKSRPVIVWERRPEQQTGNVIPMPARNGNNGAVEQESTVKTWTVGPAESPAVVTEVSSGFGRKMAPVEAPQAIRMSKAA